MDWATLLRDLNGNAGQVAIAEKYGIAQSTVSGLMRGQQPKLESLQLIAEAENKPVWRLVQLAEKYGRQSHDHRTVA